MSDNSAERFSVVVNHEEQYSIWPEGRPIPGGWEAVGKAGPKEECLEYITEVWTDMRPLSLRQFIAEQAARGDEDEEIDEIDLGEPLVERLTQGRHPVELKLYPAASAEALGAAIDRRFLFVRFTDTQGGTELGVRLDLTQCAFDGADLALLTGEVRLTGSLVLDYVAVHCVAEIDLSSMTGSGWLEVDEPSPDVPATATSPT